jgi:hypothetical protein
MKHLRFLCTANKCKRQRAFATFTAFRLHVCRVHAATVPPSGIRQTNRRHWEQLATKLLPIVRDALERKTLPDDPEALDLLRRVTRWEELEFMPNDYLELL